MTAGRALPFSLAFLLALLVLSIGASELAHADKGGSFGSRSGFGTTKSSSSSSSSSSTSWGTSSTSSSGHTFGTGTGTGFGSSHSGKKGFGEYQWVIYVAIFAVMVILIIVGKISGLFKRKVRVNKRIVNTALFTGAFSTEGNRLRELLAEYATSDKGMSNEEMSRVMADMIRLLVQHLSSLEAVSYRAIEVIPWSQAAEELQAFVAEAQRLEGAIPPKPKPAEGDFGLPEEVPFVPSDYCIMSLAVLNGLPGLATVPPPPEGSAKEFLRKLMAISPFTAFGFVLVRRPERGAPPLTKEEIAREFTDLVPLEATDE